MPRDDHVTKILELCGQNEYPDSVIKRNETMPSAVTWMDGPRDYHTEQSKSDRERQISYIA